MRQQMLLALDEDDESTGTWQRFPQRVARSVSEGYARLIIAALAVAVQREAEGDERDDER